MKQNGNRIGAVAAQAGVNVQTLRYYERRGLLARPERTLSGYRRYRPETVQVVRFIKRAQGLGFTLREIQDLLRLREAPRRDRDRVLTIATAKLSDIDGRIGRLASIRRALAALVDSCQCAMSSPQCSILDTLNNDLGE